MTGLRAHAGSNMKSVPGSQVGYERAVFDVRVEVTAPEATDVFHLINLFLLLARRVAPAGVNVRYSSLKETNGSFRPTITPKRRRVAS